MAKRWKCAHCGAANPGTTLTCVDCRRIQGGVVVPSSVSAWSNTRASTPPTTRPRGRSRRLWLGRIGAVAVGLILISAGVASLSGPSTPTELTVPVADAYITDLHVGDCFDLVDPAAQTLGPVSLHRCTDPHQYELIWTGEMAPGDYPDDSRFGAFYDLNCVEAFADYVGMLPGQSPLEIFWVSPNQEAWDAGDRSIQCAAYDPSNSRLTHSLRAVQPAGGDSRA